MESFEWLICWLSKATLQKIDMLQMQYNDKFHIRNQCQVFKARTLALVFAEVILAVFVEFV